ncbi:MAG: arsenate reductase ArsC [Candidatus Thermoplasmatota archaeon]|nr:arsenate reductase ArsC [Candidatus Thermoplasmatota archaeon]
MSGKILFVCVENAGRSRMAEAFGRQAGIDCESAGTVPAESVNPMVVSAMKEIGISLGKERPRMLTDDMVKNASRIITMGCSVEEACPAILYREMRNKIIDWHLPDPKGKSMEEVRKIRDQIKQLVMELPPL